MAGSAETTLNQSAALAPSPARPIAGSDPLAWLHPAPESRSIVDISPSESVRRRPAAWSGLHVEAVQVMRHTPFEYGFRAPCHLLIALELGERLDGETVVEGLPRSTLRDFTHKLTFVPAGHDFRSWQNPRVLTRVTHFYIDPRGPLADPALRFGEIEFKPRLFFYDRDLLETALKFKWLVENADFMRRQYDAARAARQQKRVAAYIEEHVANDIPLATLAELVQLSPYHFCRSFKSSFGIPPHRYHANRRIERAKQLLANRELSVTTIALDVGFGDTSTFSAAFHRLTGQTPSRYRRSLD